MIGFLLFASIFSCHKESENMAKWPYGVNYEIFVRSYADSNGDGIGDFNGLTAKLDYLKELGVGGIWLMPIMPSPTYHKYDVVNYKAVDPEYGNQEDFQKLIAEAHKRGIRVLVDLIVNHTGSDHPWFKSAMEAFTGIIKGLEKAEYFQRLRRLQSITKFFTETRISLERAD